MKRSSTSGQPEPVFFTDRDLGPSVARELTAGGLAIETYAHHFALDNVPDVEWLRYVGEKGWIALTHNKRIRWEPDELDALMEAGVRAFFIIGKGPHPEFARSVLATYPKIRRLIDSQKQPFAARIYQRSREVDLWVTYAQWRKARRAFSR